MTYDSTNKLFSATVTATTNGTFEGFEYDNVIINRESGWYDNDNNFNNYI